MDPNRDGKRKKDKHCDEDEYRKERKSKKARTRSRSPADTRDKDSRRKRRRSKSTNRHVKQEKRDKEPPKEPEAKKDMPERKNRDADMVNTRTGGAYIPPARLRMMQAQITDKSSVAYQRLAWEALKKSIHGHINKINVGNIGIIIKELLKENIVRGRGLLCRSVIQAQAASPTFTNVYAALVAAVNSRFPNIGELLLKRLVIQFKRGFKRNDKPICISSASFIAHLVNQRVAHEILALELLTLLVETPTDDSVEVAIAFLKECGQKLTEVSSKGVNAIFEMLRNILHEGQLDKRVQYMIEVMFQVWKDGFKDHPALIEELELVPEEEQFTHLLMLDDATDSQDILNVFKFDDKYEENELKYKNLSKEILGSDVESGDEDGSGESGSEESEDEEQTEKKEIIIDNTETNLVALRRTIYLTINSSLDFEECAHKLMKMQLKPGQEVELCHMFLDCCAEQRTYEKFYGLLAQRFCNINRIYIGPFEEIFKESYGTAHRLDTNRLRNVSKFFAHLLFTDSISWEVMECVKLNEEDTTSSSRIYIKILFQELAEYMGLKKLNDRLKDPTLQDAFAGIFPRDNPKNTRFSINFFTSIGLGGLTDELREHLKQMPKNVPAPIQDITLDSDSSSESSSSSSSSSDSSSDSSSNEGESDEEQNKKKKDKSKSNKKKKTDKTSNTPQDESQKEQVKERWGHDGFFDTYGKDARRNEPRSDNDNFARPRDVTRRNDRDRPRNNHEEDRRKDRRGERNGHRDEEDSRRYRDKEEKRDQRGTKDDRGRDDDRNGRDRETGKSKRDVEIDVRERRRNMEREYQRKSENDKMRKEGNSSERSLEQGRRKREKDYDIEDNSRNRRKDTEKKKDQNNSDSDEVDSRNHRESRNKSESSNEKSSEKAKYKGNKENKTYEDEDGTSKSSRRNKEKKRDSDGSNTDDGENSKRHKRGKGKERSSYNNESDDGWDIRRGSSMRKEVVGRYWGSYSGDTKEKDGRSEKKRGKERSDNDNKLDAWDIRRREK